MCRQIDEEANGERLSVRRLVSFPSCGRPTSSARRPAPFLHVIFSASKRVTPGRQTPADDSSESDTYGGARARARLKKARRQEPNKSLLYAEKRWSSRRAAQVSVGMYQEESEHDEDEDEEMTPGNWVADEEDDRPYIEKVIRHRIKEGVEWSEDCDRGDFEYYIKWQGKSHLHDTWETVESLKDCRGFRRLENYFRKNVDKELDMRFGGSDIPPEVREQYLLDKEREEEAHEDYTKVERIVSNRINDNGQEEYYVKWKGLTYDCCTWEEASLVTSHAQDKISQYLERMSHSWQSDRKEANPATRSKFVRLEEQPDYIVGGELRSFQLFGLNFLCLNWTRGKNVILADEMGLGKTVQTVSFLSWLKNDRGQEGPFLVVAPLSVIPAWCDTFNTWAPDINYVVYGGPEEARKIIRDHELIINGNPKRHKFNVLVTTYDYILADSEFLKTLKWQVLAVDEAHRLKNRESQLYAKLEMFGVPCKVLITGTPIQNNLQELSALLDFNNPGEVVIDEDLESLSAADTEQKLKALHESLKSIILRRTKEKVENDLPPKTEKLLRVELSDVQLEYYKNILTRNYAALTDATGGHKQSLLNIMMELKKISNHPYMFPGAEEKVLGGSDRREDQLKGLISSSGKMMLLDKLLSKLKADNHRVLIFSQMVRMLDILSDYLRLRGYQFQRLDGTIAAGPRRMAINHFNAEGSEDFCFLLSTRAGGLGINLMTADTVVIFDSDWNPQADLQAMARAHRIGQKKPVTIYRLVSKETVEEEVLERARNKLLLEYLTIQAGVTDDGKALREKFNEKNVKFDDPKSAEDIQMVLKMRSQKMFEQQGNQERLEQLDIDSILENAEVTRTDAADKINLSSGGIDWDNFMSFTDVKVDDLVPDWDVIIPADQLAVIKEEEEKRRHEEYLRRTAEENAPRRAALKASNLTNGDSDRAERLAKKREREQAKLEQLENERARRSDPKRPLDEKEIRGLVRAFFRYGSLEERGDDVVVESRLEGRDREVLRAKLAELTAAATRAIEEHKAKIREEEEQTGKVLAKKDKKAILLDFGIIKKVNAETVLERPVQLRCLRKVLQQYPDWRTFRITEAKKAAHYTCEWGPREDAALMVGVDRYGYGAWTQIRDDAELGLTDKFFLEEHRVEKKEERSKENTKSVNSPGPVHLVRRVDYLFSVLLAREAEGDEDGQKTGDAQSRAAKKRAAVNGQRRGEASNSISASPAPQAGKKPRVANGEERPSSKLGKRKQHGDEDEGSRNPKYRKADEYEDRPSTKDGSSKSSKLKPALKSHDAAEAPRGRDSPPAMTEEEKEEAKKKREAALARIEELRRTGQEDSGANRDSIALTWALLKPVRSNIDHLINATKDNIPSRKERANVMRTELLVIGGFLSELGQTAGFDESEVKAWQKAVW